jgi:hypothetical protein
MDPGEQEENQFGRLVPPYNLNPHPGQPSDAPPPQQAPASQNGFQPVAYDKQGRPLYAHPAGEPQMVYIARPIDPQGPMVTEKAKERHAQSVKLYPKLNLSEGEYIISAVKRHPIGLLRIWGIAVVIILALVALFIALMMQNASSTVASLSADRATFATIGLGVIAIMMIFAAIGALIGSYVYSNNRFFLTNESVIQETQTSPFSKHEQTVSLSNIEDASFEQHGILQSLLNYGRIRLSTEGDETTYRFKYVSDPKKQVALLNNAVESFKNGRPVDPNEAD